MAKCPQCGKTYDDRLKKCLECELPMLEKTSWEYSLWWNVQVISLFMFVIFLILGIIQDWLLLLPAFLCLFINLLANIRRMKVKSKTQEGGE